MFGLEQKVIDLVLNYFTSKDKVLEVYIYGSRAMGKESKGSDIDFAIVTSSQDDLSGQVKLDLEELPTPYIFDVCDLKYLTNPSLYDHIKRVGKLFYKRS
jgi:predicted nucleotidyltransferase